MTRQRRIRNGLFAATVAMGCVPGVNRWASGQTAAPAAASTTASAAADALSQALQDARGLTNPVEHAGVLTGIAQRYQALGNDAAARDAALQALPLAQGLPDAQAQFRTCLDLASLFHQVNDDADATTALAAAQAAADALPAEVRTPAEQQVVEVRAIWSGFANARKPIDAIPDPGIQSQAFCALAQQFDRAARPADYQASIAAARQAVANEKDPGQAGDLRVLIARAQVEANDLTGAAATAADITDPGAIAQSQAMLAQAYLHTNERDKAVACIARAAQAAPSAPEDHRPAIWLDLARCNQSLGNAAEARFDVASAQRAAERLSPADQADALAATSRVMSEMDDKTRAAVIAGDATTAAAGITNPQDQVEVMMAIASAQARCGNVPACLAAVTNAEAAARRITPDPNSPAGSSGANPNAIAAPPPPAYIDVVESLATVGDFPDAQTVAAHIADPRARHEAILSIAAAQVDASQYPAAEETVRSEGPDSEAAVCGMIAAALARTRNVDDAGRWIAMLPNPSDKVAARLAVAAQAQNPPASAAH